MLWLFLALAAYALFALVAIGDKYLLSGRLPHPLVYAFYVGLLGGLAVFFTPVFGFPVPERAELLLALASGALFVFGLMLYYVGLRKYEASRVVPAIGGLVPLGTLFTSFLLFPEIVFAPLDLAALLFLIAGSIAITTKSAKDIFSKSLTIAAGAAALLAVSFTLAKYVYLETSFWSGFLWMRIGGAIFALVLFVASSELRGEIFSGNHPLPKKRPGVSTTSLFLGNQALGAAAAILQNLAIYVAPAAAVALVNALQGTQYLFLIFFAALVSFEFPAVLHESFSRKSLFGKISAVALLGGGMALLIFSRIQ